MFMKRILPTILTLFVLLPVCAQEVTVPVGIRVDGTELRATEAPVTDRIVHFIADSATSALYLFTRDVFSATQEFKSTGSVCRYHFGDKTMQWRIPINYTKSTAELTDSGMLVYDRKKCALYDLTTGTLRWTAKLSKAKVDDAAGVLLGYQSPNSKKLSALSLSTGHLLWQTQLPHNGGWEEYLTLSPNVRLILADNLHRIDLTTGRDTSFTLNKNAYDLKGAIIEGLVTAMAGVGGCLLTGGACVPYVIPTDPHTITRLRSNICIRGAYTYIADREKVACLDSLLRPVWVRTIPDKSGSFSNLTLRGDTLLMLNSGLGSRAGQSWMNKGRLFYAAYHAKTGERIFMKPYAKDHTLASEPLLTDAVDYLPMSDGIVCQSVTDTTSYTLRWNTKNNGHLLQLLPDVVYMKGVSADYFTPVAYDGTSLPFYSDNKHIYVVDDKMNVLYNFTQDQIYNPVARYKDYTLVGRNAQFYWVHTLGAPLAHINQACSQMALVGDKLLMLTAGHYLLQLNVKDCIPL
jgi:outer membrane protein assembly factor BamB